jgi:hypothetical protein
VVISSAVYLSSLSGIGMPKKDRLTFVPIFFEFSPATIGQSRICKPLRINRLVTPFSTTNTRSLVDGKPLSRVNFQHGLLVFLFLPRQKSLNVFCALFLVFHQTCK